MLHDVASNIPNRTKKKKKSIILNTSNEKVHAKVSKIIIVGVFFVLFNSDILFVYNRTLVFVER